MNLRNVVCLFLSGALLATEGIAAAHNTGGEVLLQMERALMDAAMKGDIAALDRLDADDFTYVYDGVAGDKKADLETARTHGFQGKLDMVDAKARLYGDAGLVTGKLVMTDARWNGQDVSGNYVFTDFFIRSGGRWRIVASHATHLASGSEGSHGAPGNLYAGHWKLDHAASKLTGDTVRLDPIANGYRRTEGTIVYDIPMDGQLHSVSKLSNTMVSLRQSKGDTWEFQYVRDGRMIGAESWRLSADGKTAETHWKGTTIAGEAFDDQLTRTRSENARGLEGAWTSTKATKSGVDDEFLIEVTGTDRERLTFPSQRLQYEARLDGVEYPVVGPSIPAGVMQSVQLNGPYRRTIVMKARGEKVGEIDCVLSTDMQTLTETAKFIDSDTPLVYVYKRSSLPLASKRRDTK